MTSHIRKDDNKSERVSVTKPMRYIIYCRKSDDSEDRQVQSIESQYDEVTKTFSGPDISVVGVLRESRTAKVPGRPLFNEMMDRIERGEADGILAWHPDRLSRNPIDSGRITYLLDQGLLKDLRCVACTVENSAQGKFMLQINFAYSKYYVDSLSENVKRGNRAKVARGWRPNMAPLGYLNDKNTRTIIPDPERFALIRKLFDRALTGSYSLRQLRDQSIRWELRTVPRKRQGGGYLTIAGIHRLLRNPFYAGRLIWKGENVTGAHRPMVTLEEIDRVRRLLGRNGKQAPQKRTFPFTGLIRCGECGFMVTAEEKVNRFGTHYTYYHCSKRRLDYRCRQPVVQASDLANQLENFLAGVGVPQRVHDWALSELKKAKFEEDKGVGQRMERLATALATAKRGLSNVTSLRVRELIDDDEFSKQRQSLQAEESSLQEQLQLLSGNTKNWFEPAASAIWFSSRALSWFRDKDCASKREIIKSVGSNPILTDKIVSISARKPFLQLSESRTLLDVRTVLNDVRTLWINRDPEFLETMDLIRKVIEESGEEPPPDLRLAA